jgi:hypothetical protein
LRVFSAAVLVAGVAAAAEPPRREIGVARISSSAGDASKKHGARGDISAAEAGLPLVAGDTVMTGPAGRMEVRLDESNYLRLGRDSEARLKQLGEKTFQVEVVRGTVSYSMLKHGEADVDLETPNSNVVPRKDGIYRVTVLNARESLVIVRKGEAEVLTPKGTLIAKKNKEVTVSEGTARLADRAPAKDTFDEWAERRNEMLDRDRGPVYARGPWYPGPHIGVGWGWPYYDPFWYPYYGGFGPRVVVRAPVMVGRVGGGRRR